MNNKYIIILKSQLGPKTGTLRIRESKEKKLWGVFDLLGHKTLLVGQRVNEGQLLEMKGKLWTPIGFSVCLLSVTSNDNELVGKLKVDNKYYEISGKR